ncbi:fructose 1,6-bisphosphatase [Sungkyunkwania multivorans]|uniref:Fructose 1,6-bisphosphatase n=1 Tax=Sungkyunkwania multivorans TaxID=1173618 RepID=A0ABW3CTM3_9FLAO
MSKQKEGEAQPSNATIDPSSKIEAIKNLIFGENIQEYNTEFDKIKQDIQEKKEELNAIINDVRAELFQNIDNLSTDLNIRITELENSLQERTDELQDKKVDRALLGDLLIKLGENIRK